LLSKHPRWLDDEVYRIKEEVADIIHRCESVKIVFPPECSYEEILKEIIPGI